MSCLKPFVTWWTSTSTVRISPWTSSCRISLANPPSRSVGCYLKHVLFHFCHLWFQVLAQSCHFDLCDNWIMLIRLYLLLVNWFLFLSLWVAPPTEKSHWLRFFSNLLFWTLNMALLAFILPSCSTFTSSQDKKKKTVTAQCYILIIWIRGWHGSEFSNLLKPTPTKINLFPSQSHEKTGGKSRSTPGRMTPIPSHSHVVVFFFFFFLITVNYSKNIVQITACPPY